MARSKERAQHRRIFSPAGHATNIWEFIIGSIITGLFLGIGSIIGMVLVKGFIKTTPGIPNQLVAGAQ